MTWWLKKILRTYREELGCPPPADPDWEPPCRLCRWADAALAGTWKPLGWESDGPVVAEVQSGMYAIVEASGGAWAWRVEREDGWELRVLNSGTEASLTDALQAAETAAHEGTG